MPATTPDSPLAAHTPAQRLLGKVITAVVLLVLVVWAGAVAMLALRHQDALDAEIRQNRNLARALEEQTLRVLATTDQALVRLRSVVADAGPAAMQAGSAQAPDMVRLANETGLAPKILVQLSLVGSDGHFLFSNVDPDGRKTGGVDLSQREHIRAHLAPESLPAGDRPAAPEALFIGKPVLGKVSQKWTIQLSRRLGGPGQPALGVGVASLDPSYFEDVYRRVDLGRLGSVALIGRDLTLRARVVGGQIEGMGTTLGSGSAWARHVGETEGWYRSPGAIDGRDRIVAFRQVGGYPLYVLVTTATDEALASWTSTRNTTVLLTLLLTLTLALGTTWFAISLRRLERSHAALRASEAQAQAANQAKSQFLTAISHELRTPLTSIRGFAEVMERRLEAGSFRDAAGMIRKGAEHLDRLLTEILDLSKVEAGAMTLDPQPTELTPLLQGTVDFFSLTAAEKGLGLRLEMAPDLPTQVVLDGFRTKQILNNLLSNALKFTQHGEVRVRASTEAGRLQVDVIDTGPGVPADKQSLIFERFRQADAQVSFQHGGTGLGLALSRGLAELAGGSLTLHSVEGQGSTFSLRLPLTTTTTTTTTP